MAPINARMLLRDIAERQVSGLRDPGEGRAKKALEEMAARREAYYNDLKERENAELEMLRVNRDYAQEMQSVRANAPASRPSLFSQRGLEDKPHTYESMAYRTAPEAQKVQAWRDARIADIKDESGYNKLLAKIAGAEKANPELLEEQEVGQNTKTTRYKVVNPFQNVQGLQDERALLEQD